MNRKNAIEAMHNTKLHWQHAVNMSRTAMSNAASDKGKTKNTKTATLENAQTLEAKVLFYNTSYLTNL